MGQSTTVANSVAAEIQATTLERTQLQAARTAQLRHRVSKTLVRVPTIVCLVIGKRANTSTEKDKRTKPSRLVGSLEAKQTAAKRPALRDKALMPSPVPHWRPKL